MSHCELCQKETIKVYLYKGHNRCNKCLGKLDTYEIEEIHKIQDYWETNIIHAEHVIQNYASTIGNDNTVTYGEVLDTNGDDDSIFIDTSSNEEISDNVSEVIVYIAEQLEIIS